MNKFSINPKTFIQEDDFNRCQLKDSVVCSSIDLPYIQRLDSLGGKFKNFTKPTFYLYPYSDKRFSQPYAEEAQGTFRQIDQNINAKALHIKINTIKKHILK